VAIGYRFQADTLAAVESKAEEPQVEEPAAGPLMHRARIDLIRSDPAIATDLTGRRPSAFEGLELNT
jgi:hypothetical protein